MTLQMRRLAIALAITFAAGLALLLGGPDVLS
jgi:hypothetical protein